MLTEAELDNIKNSGIKIEKVIDYKIISTKKNWWFQFQVHLICKS